MLNLIEILNSLLNKFSFQVRIKVRSMLSPVRLLDDEMLFVTREILLENVYHNSQWLDVGCGLKPFADNFNHAHYTGIDVEVSGRSGGLKNPDKFFDGMTIPYNDNKFDGILSTQVLEHVENLDILLAEINRCLKINGKFILSVPFVFREHEQPFDYRRFTSYGIILALTRNGFQVSSCLKCLSAIETIATIFSVYISNNIGSKNRFLHVLTGIFLIMPSLTLSKFLSRILPDDKDLFCVLISCAIKVSNIKG